MNEAILNNDDDQVNLTWAISIRAAFTRTYLHACGRLYCAFLSTLLCGVPSPVGER